MQEVEALARGEAAEPQVFPYQIAYNVIPQIGGESTDGYTSEEMKMQNEGRKIMHLPGLLVNCTCVRVPVVRSHSISVTVQTERPVSVEEAARRLQRRRAAGWRMILPAGFIRCRWKHPIRIWFLWEESAGILRMKTAWRSGAAAIRCAKAPQPMPFRLQSSYNQKHLLLHCSRRCCFLIKDNRDIRCLLRPPVLIRQLIGVVIFIIFIQALI